MNKTEQVNIRVSAAEKNLMKDLGLSAADIFHEALVERSASSERRRAIRDRFTTLLSIRPTINSSDLLQHFSHIPETLLKDVIAELVREGVIIESITYHQADGQQK